MTGIIKKFEGEYRWLSNFWPCIVEFEGVEYPSTENAYQAAKTTILKDREIFETCTPGQAKRLGRTVTLCEDWDEVKFSIMNYLNYQKYSAEPLKSRLMATNNQLIEEGNDWGDTFWGVCKGQGENHLGRILMKIRQGLIMGWLV